MNRSLGRDNCGFNFILCRVSRYLDPQELYDFQAYPDRLYLLQLRMVECNQGFISRYLFKQVMGVSDDQADKTVGFTVICRQERRLCGFGINGQG